MEKYAIELIEDRLGFKPSEKLKNIIAKETKECECKSFIYYMVHEIQNGYHLDQEEFIYPLEGFYNQLVKEWEKQV